MLNWNNVDFDEVLGDELDFDSVLKELNRNYGMNFELGSVLTNIERDLIAEKSNGDFSVASPQGDWIPCTLTEEQMELVSGGGSWVGVNQYVVVNTVAVVNAAVGVGAVASVVAAVAIVVLVVGAGGGGGGGGGSGGGGFGGGNPDVPVDQE